MGFGTFGRHILRLAASSFVILSLTAAPRIPVLSPSPDPLRPPVVQKSDLVCPVSLRSEKRSGVSGFDKASPFESNGPHCEVLSLALNAWPGSTPAPTSASIAHQGRLRSPPRLV